LTDGQKISLKKKKIKIKIRVENVKSYIKKIKIKIITDNNNKMKLQNIK